MAKTLTVTLETPVEALAGVGPAYVDRLARLDITDVRELLHYFPRKYEDLRAVKTVDELQRFGGVDHGEHITVRATVLGTEARRSRHGKMIVKASIGNERGFIEAVWFNQPYLAKQLRAGEEYIFAGKLKTDYGRPSLQSPTHEPVTAEQTHTARLVPVYPETNGLSSKWLRAKLKPLLGLADQVTDDLPQKLRARFDLPPVAAALRQIHFPDDEAQMRAARRRFDFAQLLVLQLATLQSRQEWRASRHAYRIPYEAVLTKEFVSSLPWSLTDEQRLSIHEILQDLDQELPMMRLLQGDVGSGKTAVAAAALHQAVRAGYQAALMAPTEVLARQHVATLAGWLVPHGITVLSLFGSDSASRKREVHEALDSGAPSVVVGTHALIQEDVRWERLALAIVDEQHRFGVDQRAKLRGQHTPHLLTMTATPIPRSLALVAYGDQDLSVIKSRPTGRQPVATKVVLGAERETMFSSLRDELTAGHQAFVVYPVIEESVSGLKDATTEVAKLQEGPLRGFRLELLHGRLKSDQKEAVMRRFVAGETDAVVSTTVIEVGVDVPNATVMIVEEAQQFGLAQLHQLRGRVGRGTQPAFCYLVPGEASTEDDERLRAMEESTSGFHLAEVDLKLRGPGDLLGTKQSGFDVSIEALSDTDLLRDARAAADDLLSGDADLSQHPLLRARAIAIQRPV